MFSGFYRRLGNRNQSSGFFLSRKSVSSLVLILTLSLAPSYNVLPQGEKGSPPDSDILLRIAEEAYKDRRFYKAVESLRNFLVLYPGNSKKTKALSLLRDCFLKLDRPEKALEVSLDLYKMEPTGESGLESYLEAGRLLVKMGETDQAKEIFSSICRQSYSRAVAEKAALEFSGIDLLSDRVEPSPEGESCREK
nr:tetratricopeptide repeat protein [Leptospira wolffii]